MRLIRLEEIEFQEQFMLQRKLLKRPPLNSKKFSAKHFNTGAENGPQLGFASHRPDFGVTFVRPGEAPVKVITPSNNGGLLSRKRISSLQLGTPDEIKADMEHFLREIDDCASEAGQDSVNVELVQSLSP
jgi:hypothetical protein